MDTIKEHPLLFAAAATAVGCTSAYCIWRWTANRITPPKESAWQEVGVLVDAMCFPIKSCGVLRAATMECTQMGLRSGGARDRYFVVVNEANKNFQSARAHPRMVLVEPKFEGDSCMVLNAPNVDSLRIDLGGLANGPLVTTTLWETPFKSVDCGDEAAEWISRFILSEDHGLRLMHYPDGMPAQKRSRLRDLIADKDSGAYPDCTSFNLINESSVDDLNARLTNKKVVPQVFRPNFVVRGPGAYEEDHWQWVRIGDVTFRVVKYCTRCVLTTVDPKTGVKDPEGEPLAMLKKYRMIGTKKYDKNSPVMGIHLVLHTPGKVNVGDKVFIV